jgi:hypothetical protein
MAKRQAYVSTWLENSQNHVENYTSWQWKKKSHNNESQTLQEGLSSCG